MVPKLCKYELRKQFFVNRAIKLWKYMLPGEVVSDRPTVSAVLRDIIRWVLVYVIGICTYYNYKADT